MQQYYEQGKKDKQNGLTLSQAKQRVENFHCPESYTGGDKTVILGKEYDADNPEKQQQIILSAAISAYWDGYNGKPWYLVSVSDGLSFDWLVSTSS